MQNDLQQQNNKLPALQRECSKETVFIHLNFADIARQIQANFFFQQTFFFIVFAASSVDQQILPIV